MAAAPKQDAAAILQQLNLAALRTRMHDLQSTISRITQSIHANPSSKWVDVLDQFAVVNLELLSLVDDIKPMLRAFLVYPKNVTAANAPILPIMLSSKLLPELEAEEAALKERVLTPLSNLSLNAQTDKLQKQIELVRTVCDTAEKVLADGRKTFGLSTRQGVPPLPTIDKAQAARILEQEKQLHAAANFGDGLRLPSEQRTSSVALPPHIAAALASGEDGYTRTPQTSGVRPSTPQQIISGAPVNGPPPALAYTNSPRPSGFSDIQAQQQQQQQQQQMLLLHKAKFQQKSFAQQQLRQPATPPLPQMQITHQSAPQSLLQQSSKMHQFPQSHLQLQLQHMQERQQHFHLQQLNPQLQASQMRPQMGAYGNPQPLLPSNMMNLSQPRVQYGAPMSAQSQRNQMLTDPMYMGGGQSAASLGLPLQQQIPGQGAYNLINPNQTALLNATSNNFVANHPNLLAQNTLLNPNGMPAFNQVRQQQPQQQQPPTQ